MIRVAIVGDSYAVDGHAEYAEAGQDIVCASVSTLTQYTAMLLEKFTFIEATVDKEDGVFEVKYDPNDTVKPIMTTMYQALLDLERQYPEHIKIYVGRKSKQ